MLDDCKVEASGRDKGVEDVEARLSFIGVGGVVVDASGDMLGDVVRGDTGENFVGVDGH